MATIIKTYNLKDQKKNNLKKVCKCNLQSTVTGSKNGKVNFVESILKCVCKDKKSLLNKKDNSFGVKVDSFSTKQLNQIFEIAKESGLEVQKITSVNIGDYIVFGKSCKKDVIVVDSITNTFLNTKPVYKLSKDFKTILKAILEYSKEEGLQEVKSFFSKGKKKISTEDIIVTNDWIWVNGVMVGKNSASDVYLKTKKEEVVIPGFYSEVVYV